MKAHNLKALQYEPSQRFPRNSVKVVKLQGQRP